MANTTQIKLLVWGVVVFPPPDLLFYLGLLDLNIMSQLLITCLSFCTLQPKKKFNYYKSWAEREARRKKENVDKKIFQKHHQ